MAPSDPLRVLLVSPDSTGGIGTHVRLLAAGLGACGCRVTVCAPAATIGRFALDEHAAAVAAPVGRAAPAAVLDAARTLRRLSAAADVVHAHGARAGALAGLVAAAPVLTTWHNAPLGSPAHRRVHAALELVSARTAQRVLAASPDLSARARTAGAGDVVDFAVPAPPVGPAPGSAGGQPPPDRAALASAGELLVLSVARLHPQKRLDLLIDALTSWPATLPAVRLVVAGEGPLEGELRRRADRQQVPTHWLGRRDDVPALLELADLMVLPSEWEARPLAAQEALRAGVPLVATDVGGVAGLVGDAALLVPPGDVAALRAAMVRLAADPALRAELRRRGPAQAARWPGLEESLDLLVQHYRDVAAAPPRRHRRAARGSGRRVLP